MKNFKLYQNMIKKSKINLFIDEILLENRFIIQI